MRGLFASVALSAFTYSTLSAASTASRCPVDNVCFQIGVPEASASSGDGNIYLQLRAPTSYSWVALGTGTQMAGANIFLMYTNGEGNVTVSTRKGTGYVEPSYQTDTKIELLAGSGIIDDGQTMLANVRCSNCESWDGGSLSLSSTAAPFIAAWKKGSALNTNDLDASIRRHDANDQFTFDLTRASIDDDTNPFVQVGGDDGDDDDDDTDNSTPPNDSGNNDNNGSSNPSSGSGSGSDSGSSSLLLPAWIREIPTIRSAHGILMSIVMVLLYPIGAILMPLFGSWVLHAVWQTFAFLTMWAAFGLGVVLANRTGYGFHTNHTLLGTVVIALFAFQPIGGYIHHLHFMKHQKRGLVSYGHIWYGRILIVLGIINGGLGLQLAGAGRSLVIAYSVVAAVVFVAYVVGAVYGETKRKRNGSLEGYKGNA